MGKFDLGKLKMHTDLIIDDDGKKQIQEFYDKVMISRNNDNGNYVTISFEDITDFDNRERVGEVLEGEIKRILKINKIKEDDEVLIVGLGNRKSTPDSLGPKTIDNVMVTNHLFLLNKRIEGIRRVMTLTPSVMAETGMETAKIIMAVIEKFKPKFVIAIDSLASSSVDRISKTIQITDTGIHPGSGIGNNRIEISKKTLGIPVIALGVPTVVSSQTIVYDTLKLIYSKNKRDVNVKGIMKDDMEEFMVTPKEIDFLIDKFGNVIGNALNNSLHRQITHF